jgi:hypothetical protein
LIFSKSFTVFIQIVLKGSISMDSLFLGYSAFQSLSPKFLKIATFVKVLCGGT